MFSMTKLESFDAKYGESASKSFLLLTNHIEKGITLGILKDQDPFKISLSVWAYIHGCASFYVNNMGLPFGLGKENLNVYSVDILLEKL